MFSINRKVAKLGAFEVELKCQEDNRTYGKHLWGRGALFLSNKKD